MGLAAGVLVEVANTLSISRVDHVPLGFVDTAAQVLPVLVIAVALEGRLMRSLPEAPVLRAYYGVFMGWMLTGEVAAFVGLAIGRATPLVAGLTDTALGMGAPTLAIVLLVGFFAPDTPNPTATPATPATTARTSERSP